MKDIEIFKIVTQELYETCRNYIAWYDDMVSGGCGCFLTQNDIKSAKLAEEIIKLYRTDSSEVL